MTTRAEYTRIEQTLETVIYFAHPARWATLTEERKTKLRDQLKNASIDMFHAGYTPNNPANTRMTTFDDAMLRSVSEVLLNRLRSNPRPATGGRRRKTRKGKGKKSRRMTRKH